MSTTLINPLDEMPTTVGKAAPRLDTLAGAKIALLDISKPGGKIFLDQIELLLKGGYGVNEVLRIAKPTFTKPAPDDVISSLTGSAVDGVIEALAD